MMWPNDLVHLIFSLLMLTGATDLDSGTKAVIVFLLCVTSILFCRFFERFAPCLLLDTADVCEGTTSKFNKQHDCPPMEKSDTGLQNPPEQKVTFMVFDFLPSILRL